jgi:hypothetical protein
VDPNNTRVVNYKNVKQICDDKGLEFSNQSLVSVVKTMRQNFMKVERCKFDKKFRNEIFKSQGRCCQMCREPVKINYFQIDHIRALANGGNNDIENLQILCRQCHFTKTREEAENGWVKQSDTLSSFNSQTLPIFNSELAKVWAFVEKIAPGDDNEHKIFGIDINKCRKNCMYYNKYNYPLFTVMDKVEAYDGDHSRCGLYYVECAVYFPLRGNGWYSQPMIEYCLKKHHHRITYQTYTVLISECQTQLF